MLKVLMNVTEQILEHCQSYLEQNQDVLEPQYQDLLLFNVKEVAGNFVEQITPYINDHELSELSSGKMVYRCRKSTHLILQLLEEGSFAPSETNIVIQQIVDSYSFQRVELKLDTLLARIGGVYVKSYNLSNSCEFFDKQLGLIVITKLVYDAQCCVNKEINVELFNRLLSLFYSKVITHPGGGKDSVRATNVKKRAELMLKIADFRLVQWQQAEPSIEDLFSIENHSAKASKRLLSEVYVQIIEIAQDDGSDNIGNVVSLNPNMTYLQRRLYLATTNRWIETSFPNLHSNVTGTSVNGIEYFKWLSTLFVNNKTFKIAFSDFFGDIPNKIKSDTPDEKIAGQYWGGKFEQDYLRPKVEELGVDKKDIYKNLLLNNLGKALKAYNEKAEIESQAFDELLEFLYLTANEDIKPFSLAYEVFSDQRGLRELSCLFDAISVLKKKEKEDVKVQLMEYQLVDVLALLPASYEIISRVRKSMKELPLSELVEAIMEDTLVEVE